jgi:hypothetical protein
MPKSTDNAHRVKRLPKLSDAERHKHFLVIAREVWASEDPKDFDRAFDKVITCHQPKTANQNPGQNQSQQNRDEADSQ